MYRGNENNAHMRRGSSSRNQMGSNSRAPGSRPEPHGYFPQPPARAIYDSPEAGRSASNPETRWEVSSGYQPEGMPPQHSLENAYPNTAIVIAYTSSSQLLNGLNPENSMIDAQLNQCIDPSLLGTHSEFSEARVQTHPAINFPTSDANDEIVLESYPSNEYNPHYSVALSDATAPPWNHLTVNCEQPQPGIPTQPHSMHHSMPSNNPSGSMPGGSGYSSLSNAGETETSNTSNEALYSNLLDSTETIRPPPMPNSSRQILLERAESFSPLANTVPNWTSCHDNGLGSSLGRMSLYGQQLPLPHTARSRRTSSSAASIASSAVPDILRCQCSAKFSGKYRIGNLGRHMRTKHGINGQREYPCEVEDCTKTYMRQDARLKHYRKEHPDLAAPAESRR